MKELLNSIRRLLGDYADVREHADALGQLGRAKDVVQRRGALANLFGSLRRAGQLDRVCEVAAVIVQNDTVATDNETFGYVLYMRSRAERDLGRPLHAIGSAHAARHRFLCAADERGVALCDNMLGTTHVRLQQWTLAEHHLQLAYAASEKARYLDLLAAIRNNLAIMHSRRGNWRLALKQILALKGQASSPTQALTHRVHVARALRSLGFARRSIDVLMHASDEAERLNQPRAKCLVHEFLGDCLQDCRKPKRAREIYEAGLAASLAHAPEGDVTCEAYRRLAEVHLVLGNLKDSEAALAEGLRLADHLHDDYERVGLLRVQAGLALEAGDLKEADRIYHKAATLALAKGFRFEHALTLETQGFAHRSTARPDTATRFINEARAIYEELGMTRLALRLGRGVRALSRPRPKKTPTPLSVKAKEWERFGILTRSHRMLKTLDEVRAVSPSDISVLLIGESGVGKELLVRALHELSGRPGRFVAMNTTAIQDTMLESELFGSRRGAFTGAENREGLVAEADGGTLFLDEIGDMPLALQMKLLRFLEDSTYRPVGGKKDRRVDVRFVSATNADLERKVRKGTFREDLYHRIAGDVIQIPPLRQRPEDVEFLANHFLAEQMKPTSDAVLPTFDDSTLKAFRSYAWSGNVRELKNAVQRAALRVGAQKKITPAMLPERILKETGFDLERDRDVQRLTEAVVDSDGSISAAAKLLGISRQTLYRRAEVLGVDLDAIRGS